MSRRFPRILVLPSLLALTAILACGGDDNPADPDPVTTSVAVTPSSSTLVAGDSVTLSAQARNSDGAV
ncbi:MAG: hypothetical protein KJP18_01995, partial [Gemmatimonadetes bacterium]|nr:hypothetical protein [Gemmatimonadota bacterium]